MMDSTVSGSKTVVQTLAALCTLSNATEDITPQAVTKLTEEAPDPETAIRRVFNMVSPDSEVLSRKWREELTHLWAAHHPHVPLLASLPLTGSDVAQAAILKDAHAYIEAVSSQPAEMVAHQGELVLAPGEIERFVGALPSFQGRSTLAGEGEWAHLSLRRLRAVLQAARLVRVYQGHLVVVRSRYNRWRIFPAVQQLYVLWHADVYHVNWADFAGQWRRYVHVVQEYLPLLWDLHENVTNRQADDERDWCMRTMEAYAPLWAQAGLFDMSRHQPHVMSLFQQCMIPGVLHRMILSDLFLRYGLVVADLAHDSSDSVHGPDASGLTWTQAGQAFIEAERTCEMPCSIRMLDA